MIRILRSAVSMVMIVSFCATSGMTFASGDTADPSGAGSIQGTGSSGTITMSGQESGSRSTGAPPVGAVPVTRVVSCGPLEVRSSVLRTASDVCGQVRDTCSVPVDEVASVDASLSTQAVQRRTAAGVWVTVGVACGVRGGVVGVTPLLVAQVVRRLVPRPGVGVASVSGVVLVNVQTVLWVGTGRVRVLAPVVLVGRRVVVRVSVVRVVWDFGDGSGAVVDGPGRAYDPGFPCRTVLCPGYGGHVYGRVGVMGVSARVVWSGEYQVDGGAWLAVPGLVESVTPVQALRVVQARAVLVDPTSPVTPTSTTSPSR